MRKSTSLVFVAAALAAGVVAANKKTEVVGATEVTAASNLVARYDFADSTNLGKDVSGNDHNLVGGTGVEQGEHGININNTNVAEYEGTLHATQGDSFTDNVEGNFTITFWSKQKTSATAYFVMTSFAGNSTGFVYWNNGGMDYMEFRVGEGETTMTAILDSNENWHMFTLVCDDTNATSSIYVDGVLKGTQTRVNEKFSMKNTNTEDINYGRRFSIGGRTLVSFGNGWYETEFPFVGSIDDLRIYNKALSETEVAAVKAESSIVPGTSGDNKKGIDPQAITDAKATLDSKFTAVSAGMEKIYVDAMEEVVTNAKASMDLATSNSALSSILDKAIADLEELVPAMTLHLDFADENNLGKDVSGFENDMGIGGNNGVVKETRGVSLDGSKQSTIYAHGAEHDGTSSKDISDREGSYTLSFAVNADTAANNGKTVFATGFQNTGDPTTTEGVFGSFDPGFNGIIWLWGLTSDGDGRTWAVIGDNTWTVVTITYEITTNKWSVYENGVLARTGNAQSNKLGNRGGFDSVLSFGGRHISEHDASYPNWNETDPICGTEMLDDIRYYEKALNASEVAKIATGALLSGDAIRVAAIEEANAQALQDVLDKIDAIGTVTVSSAAAISAARTAYEALSGHTKAQVSATQLKVLTDAEAAYVTALESYKEAAAAAFAANFPADNFVTNASAVSQVVALFNGQLASLTTKVEIDSLVESFGVYTDPQSEYYIASDSDFALSCDNLIQSLLDLGDPVLTDAYTAKLEQVVGTLNQVLNESIVSKMQKFGELQTLLAEYNELVRQDNISYFSSFVDSMYAALKSYYSTSTQALMEADIAQYKTRLALLETGAQMSELTDELMEVLGAYDVEFVEILKSLPETLTLEDEPQVVKARQLYDAFDDDDKEVFADYGEILVEREEEIASLKAAKELADYKTAKLTELDSTYGALDLSKYDDTAKATLQSIVDAGKSSINSAADKAAVDTALQTAKAALEAVEVIPEKEPAEKGCFGSITAASAIVTCFAFAGAYLISKKRKEDK